MGIIIKPGAEEEDLVEEAKILGKNIATLTRLAPFKDDFKHNLMTMLSVMELEQLQALHGILETLVLKEVTRDDEAALKDNLNKTRANYQQELSALDAQTLEKMEALMAQIPKT